MFHDILGVRLHTMRVYIYIYKDSTKVSENKASAFTLQTVSTRFAMIM